MVMTKGSPSMGDPNTPNAGGADIEDVCVAYDVSHPGSYSAPTPHAAAVAHELFVAPEGDLNAMAHTGLPVAEGHHVWTKTPGKK